MTTLMMHGNQSGFVEPPLKIIDIPKKCPDTVSVPIAESFRLAFCSPSSSANSIRVAVEQLLNALGIKQFRLINGKRRYISLHERISSLPAKFADIQDLILAIKWLGNAGSHSRSEALIIDWSKAQCKRKDSCDLGYGISALRRDALLPAAGWTKR